MSKTVPQRTFNALFGNNYIRIVRYVERRTPLPNVAEDIAAETFELAWQKISAGVPVDLPWLYVTAAYKLRDHHKRSVRKRSAEAALERFIEEAPAGLETLDRLALADALAELGERDRELIMLTYWEGLSADDVGRVLGMKTNAVWAALSRARAKLRSSMDGAREGAGHDRPKR